MIHDDDLAHRWPLPLTYGECRARFRLAATAAGLQIRSEPIAARGPDDQELTIDWVQWGAARPRHLLVVLSGVHGVEGFIGSAVQTDLLQRRRALSAPDEVGVLVVHSVNPWGMAWWRRQNEANVDLNRNWRRDLVEPPANDAYDEIHPLACPDTPELPSVDDLMTTAMEWVERRGMEWVRDGITRGQYTRPDGLHYGGSRTEESNRILDGIVQEVAGTQRVLVVDLHTGHGPRGEVTLLSDQPPGSPQDRFLRSAFDDVHVEATVDNPDATTGSKTGQIANGIRDLVGGDSCATSAEFGTANDLEQLAATYQESWVHRHGDRGDPQHAAAIWRYRSCFTPDDAEWTQRCRTRGARLLDQSLDAVAAWGVDG
jgi:hypothetical protein